MMYQKRNMILTCVEIKKKRLWLGSDFEKKWGN